MVVRCPKVIAPTAPELYRMQRTVYRLRLISQTSDYALRMTQLAIEQKKWQPRDVLEVSNLPHNTAYRDQSNA